jgi:hypothetical protein
MSAKKTIFLLLIILIPFSLHAKSEKVKSWVFDFRVQGAINPLSFGSMLDSVDGSLSSTPDNYNAISLGAATGVYFLRNLGLDLECDIYDLLWANAKNVSSLPIFTSMVVRLGPAFRFFLCDLEGYDFDLPVAVRISGGADYAEMTPTAQYGGFAPPEFNGNATGFSWYGLAAVDLKLKSFLLSGGLGVDSLNVKFSGSSSPYTAIRIRFFLDAGLAF